MCRGLLTAWRNARILSNEELLQCGCVYCEDAAWLTDSGRPRCQHRNCPYKKELSQYGSYDGYLEAEAPWLLKYMT